MRKLPWWLLLALGLAACNPDPVAQPTSRLASRAFPGSGGIEASLENGWITVTVSLPERPAGPKPVVISPIVDDRLLLERGIGVVRFRTHWELLRDLGGRGAPAAASSPEGAGGNLEPPRDDRIAPASAGDGPPPVEVESGAPAPAPGAAPANPKPPTVGAWLLAAPRPGIVGRAYFDLLMVDATGTIPKVVDYLVSLPQVDPTRISIAGSSTSGFVALMALSHEPRLAGGVVRVACGDYFLFLRESSLALHNDPRWLPDGKMELDPDYAERLRAIEPIAHADRFPPRPLLLMAGADDPAIPIACVKRTAEAFEAAYAHDGVADRFRLVLFPGQGHNLGDDSAREALSWWEHWLVHDTRRAPSASEPIATATAISTDPVTARAVSAGASAAAPHP